MNELTKKIEQAVTERLASCGSMIKPSYVMKGIEPVIESVATEFARLQRIEQAAREYVNSRADNVRQFPKFQKLADTLEEKE